MRREKITQLVEQISEDDLDLLEDFLEFLIFRSGQQADLDHDECDEQPTVNRNSPKSPNILKCRRCSTDVPDVRCIEYNAVKLGDNQIRFTATIKNDSTKPITITCLINFYDQEDAILDQTSEIGPFLKPGKTWKLKTETRIPEETKDYDIIIDDYNS